jgi:shikimate kinase
MPATNDVILSLSKNQIPSSCRLFLIGMPAVGKTYWAKQIAEKYSLQFYDLDVYVSEREKASIPALFATYGENGFREKEHNHLKGLIKSAAVDSVIACGGGTPCFYDNIGLMKEAGIVIYLQAVIQTLLNNIKLSDEARPMFKGKRDIAAYLETLLEKRKSFYEQAHYILPTKDISLATFAEIISSCINKQ